MKLITTVLSMFAVVVMSGCLTETDGGGSGGGDDEEPTYECVPFLTCSAPDESPPPDEDPEDSTWDCVPFVTC